MQNTNAAGYAGLTPALAGQGTARVTTPVTGPSPSVVQMPGLFGGGPRVIQPGSLLPAIPMPPGYQATQPNALLDYVAIAVHPVRTIVGRTAPKRARDQDTPPHLPGTGHGDKKAKAVGSGGPGIKHERESEVPLQRGPVVPETEADGVDGLMSLVMHPPLSQRQPPALEPDPLSRSPESKSSVDPAATRTDAQWHQAIQAALDVPSLARLTGPAINKALEERFAVFETCVKALTPEMRAEAFQRVGDRLDLYAHQSAERDAALELAILRASSLARHMTPQQRQETLLAAEATPEAPSPFTLQDELQRRVQFTALYRVMTPPERETQLTRIRRDADMLGLEGSQFSTIVRVRANQFAAFARLQSPEQRRAELAQLRQPGRWIHLPVQGDARHRALQLQEARIWGNLYLLSEEELRHERAGAVAMTQELQDMGEATWQATLSLRQIELKTNCGFTTAGAILPALRDAVDPALLSALRGPGLERGLALRRLLVQQLFAQLRPQDRDEALAQARDPVTLADHSGVALEIAIHLRKLVFEAYFRTVPPRESALTTARAEQAAALDTAGLASQPEAQAVRAALLRLALVEVAGPYTAAVPRGNGLSASPPQTQGRVLSASEPIVSVVPAAPMLPMSLPAPAMNPLRTSPPASHTTTQSHSSPVLTSASQPAYPSSRVVPMPHNGQPFMNPPQVQNLAPMGRKPGQ